MSLKAVHLIFITASTLLAFGCAAWMLRGYFSPEGTRAELVYGTGSALAGLALIWYGRYFLKKLKNTSYL